MYGQPPVTPPPQYQQVPPSGIMPQQQRPAGFGRPADLPPQGHNPHIAAQQYHTQGYGLQGYPQQYGGYIPQVNPLTRLISHIPLNQTFTGAPPSNGDIGFNAYLFQRQQPQQQQQQSQSSGFFGEIPQQAQHPQNGMSQEQMAEQYRAQVKDYAARASNRIFEQLHNKMNRPGDTAKAVLDSFIKPISGHPDPIVVEYINEINNNIQLYRYCCAYACIIMTALFTEHALSAGVEGIERDEQLIASMLTNALTTVVALQFTEWLEKHPRNLLMVNRLEPKTVANIENLDIKMGDIERTVLSVGSPQNPIAFPWRSGVLARIRQSCEAGAVSYDFYCMYNQEHSQEPMNQWGVGSTMPYQKGTQDNPSAIEPNRNPDWYKEYKRALFAQQEAEAGHGLYNNTPQNEFLMLNPVNDNWGVNRHRDEPETPIVSQQPPPSPLAERNREEAQEEFMNEHDDELEYLAAQLRRETVHEQNKDLWFIKVPGGTATQYIVNPRFFKHIAKALRYDGREIAYEYLELGEAYLPVVDLSWETRTYNYELLYTGKGRVKFFLTNPQYVLPQLREDKENRDLFRQTYGDSVENLSNALSPKAAEEAGKGCKEMKKEPKVVHTNVPIVVESNEECVQSVRNIASLVGRKYKKRPDAIIIPAESLKPIEINDIAQFDFPLIEEHLSSLVTGYIPETNLESYLMAISKGIGAIGSVTLKNYVEGHVTDVINRWLIERRFYSPDREGNHHLSVDNIFIDYRELGEVLVELKDKGSIELLNSMANEPFFIEHLPMFASKARQEKYIEESVKKIDDPVLAEAKRESLKGSALLQKEYVIAHIDPMQPLEPQARVVLEGSQCPELHWLVREAPAFGKKHFGLNRTVPVVIMFNGDYYPRMWCSTFSSFCDYKFTLRPLAISAPLAMFKVA